MLQLLASDLFREEARRLSLLRLLAIYFLRADNRKIYVLVRLGHFFESTGRKRLARRMAHNMSRQFGCIISPKAEIGPNLRLPHPLGIVIGDGVKIGAGCTIYQQVTIGGARRGDWQAGRYPVIGNDVVLFTGAKLLGDIAVGDKSTVGANAVVTRNVPERHVAIGIPAVSHPARTAAA